MKEAYGNSLHKSTRGDKAMKKEAKKARMEQRRARRSHKS